MGGAAGTAAGEAGQGGLDAARPAAVRRPPRSHTRQPPRQSIDNAGTRSSRAAGDRLQLAGPRRKLRSVAQALLRLDRP